MVAKSNFALACARSSKIWKCLFMKSKVYINFFKIHHKIRSPNPLTNPESDENWRNGSQIKFRHFLTKSVKNMKNFDLATISSIFIRSPFSDFKFEARFEIYAKSWYNKSVGNKLLRWKLKNPQKNSKISKNHDFWPKNGNNSKTVRDIIFLSPFCAP